MENVQWWSDDPDAKELFDLMEHGGEQLRAHHEARREKQICEDIEATCLAPYLKPELSTVLDGGGSVEQRKEDIAKLTTFAKTFDLYLDLTRRAAPATIVALFLANEGAKHGYKHARRLARSISFSHRALGRDDPTADFITTAVLRSLQMEQRLSSQPRKEN
jgi:hypothetical protein